MNSASSPAERLATQSTQVVIRQRMYNILAWRSSVISVLEDQLNGSSGIVSQRLVASPASLITKELYRVDMFATSRSMCRRLYYYICCDARGLGSHLYLSRRRHHITPNRLFVHAVLDLTRVRVWYLHAAVCPCGYFGFSSMLKTRRSQDSASDHQTYV